MAAIPDFTDAERWVVQSALRERFGAALPALESAEAELQLDPGSETLTLCPTLQWNSRDAACGRKVRRPRRPAEEEGQAEEETQGKGNEGPTSPDLSTTESVAGAAEESRRSATLADRVLARGNAVAVGLAYGAL